MRIIDKRGLLHNPADRDHCIQYMTAVGLIFGRLTAADYEQEVADDVRIDALRQKMVCVEDPQYSRDYLDPDKRSIANAVQVFFSDGTKTEFSEVQYPLGHRRRRAEALPLLEKKFLENTTRRLPPQRAADILVLFRNAEKVAQMPVHELVQMFIP